MSAQDMTPAEVALTKVLAALDAWDPDRSIDDDSTDQILHTLWDALASHDVVDGTTVLPPFDALLDRARRAGVLPYAPTGCAPCDDGECATHPRKPGVP